MFSKVMIIGIDDYPRDKLNGCLNDCRNMYSAIVGAVGVPEKHTLFLADNNATKANILEGFKWLCDSDYAFCFYAGHGSLDMERVHPIMVPYDCDLWWGDPLSDKIIDQHVSSLNGIMIYDCCHSGSLHSKELDGSTLRSVDGVEYRERFMPNPLWKEAPAAPPPATASRSIEAAERVHVSDYHPQNAQFAYLSGCRDIETSKETKIGDATGGLFSTVLSRNFRAAPEQTLEQLWRSTLTEVSSFAATRFRNSPQNPQLWCPAERLGQPLVGK